MNLKPFKYVLTLAGEGSFSRAADTLNISQPSLSQYIKNIEKELGMTLFDRTGGAVRLTDAGQVYLDTGRKMLELEHQMQNQFSDLAEYKTGRIVVGVSPFRSVCFMPEVVRQFRSMYPGIHIVLEERVVHELLELAECGAFDLCITTLPVNPKVFSFEHITTEEVVIAVPSSSDICRRLEESARTMEGKKHPAVDVALLNHENVVMLEDVQLMQRMLDDLCETYRLTVNKAVECRSIEAQIAMVRAGIGVAIVPSTIEQFCGSDQHVTYFSFLQDLPRREFGVIYRKGQHLSRAVTDLIGIMKDQKI